MSESRTGRWRPVTVVIMLVLVALLAPLTVVATWMHREVSDTDRYVETVAPLAENPDVQAAVAHRVSEKLLSQLDVEAISREAAQALNAGDRPRSAAAIQVLVETLAEAIQGLVERETAKLVATPQFADAWAEANRMAHGSMVAVLTGDGDDTVAIQGDAVQVDLSAVVESVRQLLVDKGIDAAARIPTTDAQFTIFESAEVGRAQRAFDWLDQLAWVLPVAVLACLLVAVAVAGRRRRTLVAGAIVVAGSMVALGLALNWGRGVYLDGLPTEVSQPAAAAVFDALAAPMRTLLRWVLAVFAVLALVTWLPGVLRRRQADTTVDPAVDAARS